MAKWKMSNGITPATFEYDSGSAVGDANWSYTQDETPFLEEAKRDREAIQKDNNSKMRKFATIPEIVAIEIKMNHGIDIHAPDFMYDEDKKAKFFSIIRSDYAYLVVNNN